MRKLIIGLTEKAGLNISVSAGQIIAAAVVVLLVGVAGGAYWYGDKGVNESALVLNRAPAASDGIKVHGDWTLTVSNPDGSVDSVHEFKNKLLGGSALIMLMRGEGILKFDGEGHPSDEGTNQWKIAFDKASGPGKFVFADTSFLYPDSYTSWDAMEAFQLMGSFVVPPEWGDLTGVRSLMYIHPCSVPSIDYDGGCAVIGKNVTHKLFDNPISVVSGQMVTATVRISFE